MGQVVEIWGKVERWGKYSKVHFQNISSKIVLFIIFALDILLLKKNYLIVVIQTF